MPATKDDKRKDAFREELDKRLKYHYRWNHRLVFGILLGIFVLVILPERFANNIPISIAVILLSYLVVDFAITWHQKRSR